MCQTQRGQWDAKFPLKQMFLPQHWGVGAVPETSAPCLTSMGPAASSPGHQDLCRDGQSLGDNSDLQRMTTMVKATMQPFMWWAGPRSTEAQANSRSSSSWQARSHLLKD